MLNLTPNITDLGNITAMEVAQAINKQTFVWLPLIIIISFMLLSFITIGLSTRNSKNGKRTITNPNFWLIFFLSLVPTIALLILYLFYPFWINIQIN